MINLFGGFFANFAGCCALVLLGACAPFAVEPESEMLDPITLDPGKAMTFVTDAHWPDERWWSVYNDPQLDRLVTEGVGNSPSLREAAARVRMAQGAAMVSGSGRFPQVKTTESNQRTHYSQRALKSEYMAGNELWENNALLSISFTLDIWGKERASALSEIDRVAAGVANAQEAKLALQQSIVRSYIELSMQYAFLDIARETLEQRQGVLHISKELMNAGMGTELAVSQAESPIPAARAQLAEIEGNIALIKLQLAALCGQGPGWGDTIARPELKLERTPALPVSLPAELAGRRPDVVAQRWLVESAAQDIKIAKAEFYPNVDLTAVMGFVSIGFTKFISAKAQNGQVGPAITLPIFTGGRLTGQLRSNTAAYDVAVESYNQTVIAAFSAVATQVTQIQSLQKQASEAAKALTLSRRAYNMADKAYRAGLTDYLNVLSVENTLLQEKERNARIAAKRLDAYACLMFELGGGYKPVQGDGATQLPYGFLAAGHTNSYDAAPSKKEPGAATLQAAAGKEIR